MSLAVGSTIITLMKYKEGDTELVRSSAGEAIPRFQVKLLKRIGRKHPNDHSYLIWRDQFARHLEADILRK